jgi:hypothetical protein
LGGKGQGGAGSEGGRGERVREIIGGGDGGSGRGGEGEDCPGDGITASRKQQQSQGLEEPVGSLAGGSSRLAPESPESRTSEGKAGEAVASLSAPARMWVPASDPLAPLKPSGALWSPLRPLDVGRSGAVIGCVPGGLAVRWQFPADSPAGPGSMSSLQAWTCEALL